MARCVVIKNVEIEDNYGEEWRDVVLLITHTATHYMPAEKFFASGMPEGYHPGYDEGVSPMPLFDCVREDNGEEVPFSLYEWEVRTAVRKW